MSTSSAPPATSDDAWPRPVYAWYVLAIICFGYVFAFVDRIIVGLLTPAIQADLGLTDTQIGLLQGLAFAVFYTVFGLPLGWAADRFNRVRILSAGMTVWSGMTMLCGLATGFWPLFLARTGVGIGEATLNPCASSLIADYFRPSQRARAFGFYVMSTAVASILTYLIGAFIINALAGYETIPVPFVGDLKPWQVTFMIVGSVGLIPALLLQLTVKEPVRQGMTAAAASAKAGWAETRAFLAGNARTLICLLAGVALIVFEIYGTLYWQPTLFLRKYGWEPQKTGVYLALIGAPVGIVSAFMSGSVTNWFKKRGHIDGAWITVLIGAVGCTVFGALAPIMPTPALALTMFAIKSFVVNYPTAACLTAISEVTPNQYRGQVTALYVIATGLFAQGLGPLSVGLTTDYVFHDQAMVGESLALVVLVTGVIGIALLVYGRKAFRSSILP